MSQRRKWTIQRAPGPGPAGLGKSGAFEKPTERALRLSNPDSRHIPFKFNTHNVAEYYAQPGV